MQCCSPVEMLCCYVLFCILIALSNHVKWICLRNAPFLPFKKFSYTNNKSGELQGIAGSQWIIFFIEKKALSVIHKWLFVELHRTLLMICMLSIKHWVIMPFRLKTTSARQLFPAWFSFFLSIHLSYENLIFLSHSQRWLLPGTTPFPYSFALRSPFVSVPGDIFSLRIRKEHKEVLGCPGMCN